MAAQSFGLDIGSHSLRLVQVDKSKRPYRLLTFAMEQTPKGASLSESTIDWQLLADAIKHLVKDSKVTTNNVVTAFPESLIFTRLVETPYIDPKTLDSAIRYLAEEYVPIPITDVSLVYQILKPGNKQTQEKMEILLIAVPKDLIEKYLKILKLANLKPVAMETEILAVSRSVVGTSPESPTSLIISIGASTTDLAIYTKGIIAFTRSIPTGGSALSKALANELNFDISQAEEYKKTYGLLESELGGKIMLAIKPIFDVVVSEINRAVAFYQRKSPQDQIKRVLLCGGTAKLPGLLIYLAQSLGLEVQVGDPWVFMATDPALTQKLNEYAPDFTVAAGLALKEV